MEKYFYSMLDILVGVVLFLVSSVESRLEKELHKCVGVLCDFVRKLTSTSSSCEGLGLEFRTRVGLGLGG